MEKEARLMDQRIQYCKHVNSPLIDLDSMQFCLGSTQDLFFFCEIW